MKKSTPPQLFQPTREQILAEKIKEATETVKELKNEVSWERGSDHGNYFDSLETQLKVAEEKLYFLIALRDLNLPISCNTAEEKKPSEEPNNHPKGPSAP